MLPTILHTYQNHHLDSTRWARFTPRADDIIISTSYKSGTTLMQEILRQLIFLHDAERAWQDVTLSYISPWIDVRGNSLDAILDRLDAQTHRRFIKTHLALDGLPYFPTVQYIIVGRDPRDVFMSWWNHYSGYSAGAYARFNDTPGRVGAPLPECHGDIHAAWRDWITRGWFDWEVEGYPFWGNMHHVQSWWDFRHLPNIYFVHYADLLNGLAQEVRGIAAFLHIPVSDDDLAVILPRLSLDAMRRDALRLGSHTLWQDGPSVFFNKGTNGRWKEVLSPEELSFYDATATRVLTPECRRWLEQGRVAWSESQPPIA